MEKPHEIFCQQWLPLPLDRVFPFFADAGNLEALTPAFLGFKILTPRPIHMEKGTLIDYRILLHGFPMRWRTLISTWEPPHRFVDEQLRGPYALWHHTHTFEEKDGGTLVTDHVLYRLPFSWMPGSGLIHRFFVKPDLDRIFNYRRHALLRALGLPDETPQQS